MTSYRLSELPIPSRSAGMSAAGNRFDAVEPPVPPEPPTPTGRVYFSGTSVDVAQDMGAYIYMFDQVDGGNTEAFYEKQVGDELSVTVNGTAQTIAITFREEFGDEYEHGANFFVGQLTEEIPLVTASAVNSLELGTWGLNVTYLSLEEIPGGVTLEIADPV